MVSKFFVFCVATILTLAAGSAMADSIANRLGVTGRIGFIVPADSELALGSSIDTNADFIGGGGFIYGVTDSIAAELDITHAGFGSDKGAGFEVTNISLGAQYRFINLPVRHLVPYIGAGLDVLLNGIEGVKVIVVPPEVERIFNGLPRRVYDVTVDDTVGVHLSAGADYFLLRQLAITGEMKGVIASRADIIAPRFGKVGTFDPSSFSMTFGIRYFFN